MSDYIGIYMEAAAVWVIALEGRYKTSERNKILVEAVIEEYERIGSDL